MPTIKKLFFVIILIASFVPCLFAQEDVQPNPIETEDECMLTSPEAPKTSGEKTATVIRLLQILTIGILVAISTKHQALKNEVLTKTETFEKIKRNKKEYRLAIIALLATIGLSIFSLISGHSLHKYYDIAIIVFTLFIFVYYLLLNAKNQEDFENFGNETTSNDFEVYTTFGKFPEDMSRDEKQKNKELYPEMSECLLGKEPETIHHNITVPRKSFKEYREGLFYFITISTSSSASEKKFAEAMLEKFSEDKEEIEITKVEAVSLIELYNTIKEKDLYENTMYEFHREQQIGAMWGFVWPIAKAYGLKID